MKNRAKCKLCGSIIESFHSTDYVMCKCAEIFVDGGDAMRCGALKWKNFVRVDDEGHEIIPRVVDSDEYVKKPNKEELLKMLDEMIDSYEKLPTHAKSKPNITSYDMLSLLLLLSSILRADSE